MCRQTFHHPKEDALVAPPLPAVVQRFVWTIVLRCIPPAQPVAIDEDNPAQHPSIIDTWPAMAPGDIRLKPPHLLVRQPVQVAQIQSPHGACITSTPPPPLVLNLPLRS